MRVFCRLAARLFLVAGLWVHQADAEAAPAERLRRAVGRDAGFIVRYSGSKNVLAAAHAERLFVPASVMKLVTSVAALEHLGPGFTFATEVYREPGSSARVKRLVLRGGGAPDFTSEDAFLLASTLKRRGIERVERIEIDSSAFRDAWGPKGERAYEAAASATSLNYNSFGVEVCPRASGERAHVGMNPHELLLPMRGVVTTSRRGGARVSVTREKKSGRIGLSGTIGQGASCAIFYRSVSSPWRYFGETIRRMMMEVGISVPPVVVRGTSRASDVLLYSHKSKPLGDLVALMNRYSNNFIAEHLVFALGQDSTGRYAYSRGRARVADTLRSFGANGFVNADGSGLDRENRLSPRHLSEVLTRGLSSKSYGIELEASLAVVGRNGTLERRKIAVPPGALRAKTGSLNGVSSLAGTLRTASGAKLVFVLMQNRFKNREQAWLRERGFVELLYEAF